MGDHGIRMTQLYKRRVSDHSTLGNCDIHNMTPFHLFVKDRIYDLG
jgi:hypothetical protein